MKVFPYFFIHCFTQISQGLRALDIKLAHTTDGVDDVQDTISTFHRLASLMKHKMSEFTLQDIPRAVPKYASGHE